MYYYGHQKVKQEVFNNSENERWKISIIPSSEQGFRRLIKK